MKSLAAVIERRPDSEIMEEMLLRREYKPSTYLKDWWSQLAMEEWQTRV
jgi:hypothetical protein